MATLGFLALLNNTFTVARRQRVADGQGGWTISYHTLGTVRGRIRPASSAEREVAVIEQRQISHVLYLDAAALIQVERGDRVTLGSLSVDVVGRREPSQADHHYELDCLETQTEAGT